VPPPLNCCCFWIESAGLYHGNQLLIRVRPLGPTGRCLSREGAAGFAEPNSPPPGISKHTRPPVCATTSARAAALRAPSPGAARPVSSTISQSDSSGSRLLTGVQLPASCPADTCSAEAVKAGGGGGGGGDPDFHAWGVLPSAAPAFRGSDASSVQIAPIGFGVRSACWMCGPSSVIHRCSARCNPARQRAALGA
jgi:hypothetical protein